jgi:hypothetical protein
VKTGARLLEHGLAHSFVCDMEGDDSFDDSIAVRNVKGRLWGGRRSRLPMRPFGLRLAIRAFGHRRCDQLIAADSDALPLEGDPCLPPKGLAAAQFHLGPTAGSRDQRHIAKDAGMFRLRPFGKSRVSGSS